MLIGIHIIAFIIILTLVIYIKLYKEKISKLKKDYKLLSLENKENQKITFNYEYNKAKHLIRSGDYILAQQLQDILVIPYEMANNIMKRLEKEGMLYKDDYSIVKKIKHKQDDNLQIRLH